MRMSTRIDEVDAKILSLLQEDGRASFAGIAKEIGVSTPTIRKRVMRMKELGIIKKFSVIVNPMKLRGMVAAFVSLDARVKDVERIANALADLDETLGVYITAGEHNILAKILARDMAHLDRIVIEKLAEATMAIASRNSVVIRTVKEETEIKIRPGLGIVILCEYCGKEILGKPVELNVAGRKHFFCCKTCLSTIQAKIERERSGVKTKKLTPKKPTG